MSEVKRWKLKGFLPGVDGESKAIFQPTVVLAEDFDNSTRLFLDAAERCVASERREKELQQHLTATDERADVLEGLLRQTNELLYAIQGDPGAVPSSSIDAMRGEVFTALKHPKPETIAGHHSACRAVDDYKPGGGSSSCKPATKPDVELVAVEYQYRQRPLWRKDDNSGWMPWMDCSPEVHANYTASPELHYWQYETRTLYAGPNQL